jgi:membrane-associated phospholipid phosphatase
MPEHPKRLVMSSWAALATSAIAARMHPVSPAEASVFRRFNRGPDWIGHPAWLLMQAGSLGAVGVAAAATARRAGRPAGATVLAAGVGAWGIAKVFKPLVGRGRPATYLDGVVVRGSVQRGLGYPSGHAAVATALSLAATTQRRTRALAMAVAICVGSGRMYAGAHLPLDVVGGAAVGALADTCARRTFLGQDRRPAPPPRVGALMRPDRTGPRLRGVLVQASATWWRRSGPTAPRGRA